MSTLLFQPQTVTPHKQHTLIEHLARGRLWVDSWSIFGQLRSKMTKPTKNRPKTDSKLTLSRSRQASTPKKRGGSVAEITREEPKPKLFGPDIFQWGRGLPRERVGAKKFDTSLEAREIPNFLGGISRDFAGISRGRPKSLRKKSLCSTSVPYLFKFLTKKCSELSRLLGGLTFAGPLGVYDGSIFCPPLCGRAPR